MSTTTPGPTVSPVDLSQRILNQKHPPTSQQAEVIGAPAGPALVVAGAGAGKTETMAARVVWLVANGLVLPEQVLGLTFTRKAASELGRRIRDRLESLAQSSFIRDLPESDPRRTALEAVTPTVATYDSYAGDIVREYGLLYPMEPAGRIITDTERWMIARDVVLGWDGPSAKDHGVGHLISTMLELNDDMDNHLCSIDDVREETRAAIANAGSLPEREGKEGRKGVAGEVGKFIEAQQQRLDLLPLVATFRQRMDELNVMTFGQQMSRAAELVDRHAEIGVAHRRRFRVVMLDEYQDTGHTQRVMLRRLFGGGVDPDLTVTAVGDPMQSIYGFRGATASNLSTFRTDFPVGDEPAPKLQLTTSWRNPPRVLDLANAVSDWSLEWNREDDTNRPVRRLTAGRDIPGEDVRVAWFDRRDREVDWVADQLAAEYREFSDDLATPGHGRDRQFTAAVLVRRNADALPIHDALVARGVPVEMTAGPGLLDVPEVADVYATLRVLVDPDDDIALLRLLTGVRWSIGARDLAALSARARQLSRARTRAEPAGDADGADGTGVDGTGTDVGGAGGTDDDTAATVARLCADAPAVLAERLHEIMRSRDIVTVGLADALADLRGIEDLGCSDTGRRRLAELAAELGQLRRHSLGKPLPDLVADIEQMTGVRTEVLTRHHRDARASVGTSHLDRFADVVRSFADLSDASPAALVDYLRAAHREEKGLEPGEVQTQPNCVQILTVHKAKGLEWDIVAVPHASRDTYGDAVKRPTVQPWTTTPQVIPSDLRGDRATGPDDMTGAPVFDAAAVADTTDHVEESEDFRRRVGVHAAKEDDRLFYVAVTRSARMLLVSGSAVKRTDLTGDDLTSRNTVDPSVGLMLSRARLQGVPGAVAHWSPLGALAKATAPSAREREELAASREQHLFALTPEEEGARLDAAAAHTAQESADGTAVWPRRPVTETRPGVADGVRRVRAAQAAQVAARAQAADTADGEARSAGTGTGTGTSTGTANAGTLAELWERETELLVEEVEAAAQPHVAVPLGTRLTATEAVAVQKDRAEFARRRRRPVPLEPKPYAKRGTAFHTWVEQRYGMVSLLDTDDLPGASDATLGDPALERLKQAFLESPWAHRQPQTVEGDYSVTLAGHVVEGRIDAVFHEGDDPAAGWFVVDWKTGRKPTGADMEAATVQLGVYRLAWARVLSRRLGREVPPENVRAAFHYVLSNETYEPGTLPSAETLAALWGGATAVGEQEQREGPTS